MQTCGDPTCGSDTLTREPVVPAPRASLLGWIDVLPRAPQEPCSLETGEDRIDRAARQASLLGDAEPVPQLERVLAQGSEDQLGLERHAQLLTHTHILHRRTGVRQVPELPKGFIPGSDHRDACIAADAIGFDREPRRARMRGRRGQPHAAGAPVAAMRWGGVVRNRGEPRPRHWTAPSLPACSPAVTLSDENALSRSRACPDPQQPACGPQQATHGHLGAGVTTASASERLVRSDRGWTALAKQPQPGSHEP